MNGQQQVSLCASGEFSEESDKVAVFGKFGISSSDNTTGFAVVSDKFVLVKPPSSEAHVSFGAY